MNDTAEFRYFVLQQIDPTTGSPVVEARVHIPDLEKIRTVLECDNDTPLSGSWKLDAGDLQRLGAICNPPCEPDPRFNRIVPWHAIREVPYLIHTNFELPLMLDGRKPLAVFYDAYPAQWLSETLGRFDPFVRSGRLAHRLIDTPFTEAERARFPGFQGWRRAFFSLPGEEWRIDAFLLLSKVSAQTGWSEALERMEGLLLGYEDWQNDWWIERKGQLRKAL
ncbi:hypothetical protein [Mesorhizobium amorphae]|uniref:Uncharacterized protein n=1 Tax=Mesorhizobium amorphae CCNWGS0123 TaxID=1082933 RepID=G6YIP2_9HYPH|nr:hypothetical protein [Mesorhizobium amorphae]ANT51148.1 hypothetical protein A6B35_15090 [Mesorhizobium amorphae CCNWGS0123]EHH05847.1 hypothetical protein MEA186_29337 [Mesorhizobium amorphae CCNWGS0123]GLR42658.1 hypothetical protein GCM10007880_31740 [Mesorhizobium amorphae]